MSAHHIILNTYSLISYHCHPGCTSHCLVMYRVFTTSELIYRANEISEEGTPDWEWMTYLNFYHVSAVCDCPYTVLSFYGRKRVTEFQLKI